MRLKNSHMVVKKNHFLRLQQQTIKPTTRSIVSEGRVTKEVPRKPEPIRPEPKKQEAVIKNVVKSPQKAGKTSGDYELNALMTRMVDDELRDLMRKTFQNLVDDAADETECRFAKILRNEVAPDLRNVIGLNITKRLLNVHNPLCVQIQFNGKPDKWELREFLKKYNFIGFARKAINIFAAQLKGIDDFDRLCTEKEVRCGSVIVSVSPEYKFTRCPTNLNTKYKDVHLEELVSNVHQDEALNRVQNKNIAATCKSIKSPEKQEKSSPTNAKLETLKLEKIKVEKAEVQALLSNNSVKSNIVTKHVESGNKPTQNIASKETTKKQETPKVIKTENKIVTSSKPETKVTTLQKQTTPTVTSSKPETKVTTPQKQTTPTVTSSKPETKVTTPQKQTTPTVTSSKPETKVTTPQKQTTPTVTSSKPETKVTTPQKQTTLTVTSSKPETKVTIPQKQSTPTVTSSKPETKVTTPQKQTTPTVTSSKPETKVTIPQKQTTPTVTSSKPETKVTTQQKQTTLTVTAKVPPAKTITQVTPTKTLSQVAPIKSETKMDRTKGVVKVTPHKSAAKVTPTKAKQQICSKFATPKKSTDDEDDYDELDDYDILALMSEGIVLDECCGSDEE